MRTVWVALFVAFASPALADDCDYVSGFDLGQIHFLDGDLARVEISGAPAELCGVNLGDENGHEIVCASGYGGPFSFASKDYGGVEPELLVFQDHVWYRRCYEPA